MMWFVFKQVLGVSVGTIPNQSHISLTLASGHVHHPGHEVSDQDQQAVPEEEKGLVHQRSHGQGFGLEFVTHLHFVHIRIACWLFMSHFDKSVLHTSQFLLGFRFNTWMSQPITIFKVSTMQRKPPLLHTLKTPCSGCGPRVNFVSLPGPTSSAWWSFVRSRRMLQRSQRNFFAHGGLHGHGNLYQSLSILQLQDVLFKLVQAIQK